MCLVWYKEKSIPDIFVSAYHRYSTTLIAIRRSCGAQKICTGKRESAIEPPPETRSAIFKTLVSLFQPAPSSTFYVNRRVSIIRTLYLSSYNRVVKKWVSKAATETAIRIDWHQGIRATVHYLHEWEMGKNVVDLVDR